MFVEAVCPACDIDIVHDIDIYNVEGSGISTYAEVVNSWELREFVSMNVVKIFSTLPLPLNGVEEMLKGQGLGNLTEKIVEEIKLHGAYEKEGLLLPV